VIVRRLLLAEKCCRLCAAGIACAMACWLPSGAHRAKCPSSSSQCRSAIGPHVRLLFRTYAGAEGYLRVRDLPYGDQWVLWQFRTEGQGYALLRLHATVSPDRRRVLLVEERSSAGGARREYVFALGDLATPWTPAIRLTSPGPFAYLVHYPVWLDSSKVIFGVSDRLLSREGYRELVWEMPFAATPIPATASDGYFDDSIAREVERVRTTLALIPDHLVPKDIESYMADRAGLVLAPEGSSVTVPAIEALIRSYVTVSTSGRRVAVADLGKRLTVFDRDTKSERQVRPLTVFANEITALEDLRWSPDEEWLLFTERHFQRYTPLGVAKPGAWEETLSLVRAMAVQTGEVFTLIPGADASWIEPEDALYSGICF